jgi:hypothetical protein
VAGLQTSTGLLDKCLGSKPRARRESSIADMKK